jgi:hypothetical protein
VPRTRKPLAPEWSDVKPHLADLDRAQLLNLVAELYAVSRDNRAFLAARFDVGEDPLSAYKKTILRGICPDIFDRKDVSIAKAKKAITDYRKAAGKPKGLAELMVFYCEQANMYATAYIEDEAYFNSIVSVFEDALRMTGKLDEAARPPLLERLGAVRLRCLGFGWGVGDAMNDLWGQWGL